MIPSHTFQLTRIPTPIGIMLIATDAKARLRALDWEKHAERMKRLLARHYGPAAVRLGRGAGAGGGNGQAAGLFCGDVAAIEASPPKPRARSFSARSGPPCGDPRRGDLELRPARPPPRPAGGGAGGGTCHGANPIGVVVPCHRVIGANGSLTGYGGGLERKTWLLQHEGARFRAAA